MSRNVILNISLTPVVNYDSKAERYIIFYEEFPQAVAAGKSEDEAEANLAFLLEDIWSKREDEAKTFLLENYKSRISIQSSINAD